MDQFGIIFTPVLLAPVGIGVAAAGPRGFLVTLLYYAALLYAFGFTAFSYDASGVFAAFAIALVATAFWGFALLCMHRI